MELIAKDRVTMLTMVIEAFKILQKAIISGYGLPSGFSFECFTFAATVDDLIKSADHAEAKVLADNAFNLAFGRPSFCPVREEELILSKADMVASVIERFNTEKEGKDYYIL